MLCHSAVSQGLLILVAVLSSKEERKPRNAFPDAYAVVPCIKLRQLRRPHNNYFHDNGPNVVLECALWEGSPVTVKRIRGKSKEYVALLLKDADVLSQLKHPQVALLMAVYLGPIPECVCLVMEPFTFGSLHNLLHRTPAKLNLDKRIDIMKDAAEGLNYLHDQQIVHCYFNSFSVLICKNFRAKIANLEYSQVTREQRQPIDACATQETWMAPEQLRGNPPNIAADVYSLGATLWECLSRKVPWSWLDSSLVKEEMHKEGKSLPILDIWPQQIKAILQKCLGEEHCRENTRAILGYLSCARNSGEASTSDHLDAGFHERLQEKGVTVDPNVETTTSDDKMISDSVSSNINILVRRSSFTPAHKRAEARSHSIFGVSHANRDQCWRQSEIDSFGYKTAEHIAYLRRIRRHSKSSRRQWAKEVVLTRYLDGDSKRISKTTGSQGNAQKKRHCMRGSVPLDNLDELQTTSLKYDRKVWARLQEGQERTKRDVKIRTDSSENSEVELTRCVRSSSSEVLKESSSQSLQGHCAKDTAPCPSSHYTTQGECILVKGGEDDKHDVRSYKSEFSTMYTGLSWLHLSSGMAEVERVGTSRPDSDSTLLLYRRIQCEDEVSRSVSDGKLSQKRTPAPTKQFVGRREQKSKTAQGNERSVKSKEELGCGENELQRFNEHSIGDVSFEDDVTASETDVTKCPVYAITTPVFVTTKGKPVKMNTSEPSGKTNAILSPSSSTSVPAVLCASVPCIHIRLENRWHSRSLRDLH